VTPRRVVVTGASGLTALGADWPTIRRRMTAGESGVRTMHDWDRFVELRTRLAAPITDFEPPAHYSRKALRSMGRVAQLATRATEQALENAGLLQAPEIRDGRMGIAYGSSKGGVESSLKFASMMLEGRASGVNATNYIQMMAHTTAVNISVFFGLKGRIIPTSSACTSGSQGIGYAYEAIRYGRQDLMIAGGAEELCVSEVAVFDTLYAASTRNDEPARTPRPFDRARDGLVLGEGAATLILEEYEHAKARGAILMAEIVGFATNSDGHHVTQSNTETMRLAMESALRDAGLVSTDIGYISAHGTATEYGDIAESQATAQLFGAGTPISSMKGYLGHSLGACAAIESWFLIEMLREGWYAPTLNLTEVDPRCGELDYVRGEGRRLQCEHVMNNNFAFGGINTSLIFRRIDA
jgi:3-oxoacyl-[acyl-carrier-protein] synthase II